MEISTVQMEEHNEMSTSSKFQPNRTVGLEDINISSTIIFGRWFGDLLRQQP